MHPLEPTVREQARNEPGVYRFTGPRGEVLYVGKSVRLRTRLLEHFRSSRTRTRELLRVARGVEWDPVPSELEALVLEFRQIRMFSPRFNVRHRRERRWAWIRVTDEAAPRLVASRRPPAGSPVVIGPFPGTRSLPTTLRDLAHATGVRDCSSAQPIHLGDQLELLAPPRAPGCPRASLGSCPAPCAGQVTRADYMKGVREAVAFLRGNTDGPLLRIRDRMLAASRRRSFESAARWRERHDRLVRLRERVVEHRRVLDELTVVLRDPPDEAEGRPRLHLVMGARLLTSAFEPPPGSPEARALARRLHGLLHLPGGELPLADARGAPVGAREERFVVAEWFRTRQEAAARCEPPGEAIARLRGEAAPRVPRRRPDHPDPAMARMCSNSAGSTG
ncbi:MAG: hypothetical protein EA352_00025 [Gemmatimonadales bacterium]|nr:MAG: hypothetical protein EA352_00025 [Gemmatimonadales bacterium]